MHRNQSVDVHQFAMVPRAEIPRSSFRMQKAHKTTFDAGLLIPVYVEEILPGDTFSVSCTMFARMATPIFPILDNLYLDSFFFFVPNRLVWDNWKRFMGEQPNPADSISFTVPVVAGPSGGWGINSLGDYFDVGTVGQWTPATALTHIALPFRAYNLIWNTWFRDENLQNAAFFSSGDGPDASGGGNYAIRRRGKRHDYFTSCLPWAQKGGLAVNLPLGTSALVRTSTAPGWTGGSPQAMMVEMIAGGLPAGSKLLGIETTPAGTAGKVGTWSGSTGATTFGGIAPTNLYADLSTATSATINQLRQSFQIQKLLERDARGGTRYTEIVRSHFGVVSPDARLQRPEYLGGGSTPILVNPIAQTSATGVTGGTTPVGTLSAFATALGGGHGFTQSFTEHGFVIGLVSVRADLTYQQGMRRLWNRSTRYDYYFPAFAMLGEQPVLNREIFADGSANDVNTFGYQERWAEYRYNPSQITGKFRSTAAGTLDGWHAAQKFVGLPTLNDTFISDTPPISRIVAAGSGADGAQFLFDSFWDIKAARPLPLYSVPGLIDHF